MSFSITTLLKVIHKLSYHYRVLEIKGVRLSAYQSLYFDTDDFQFYHQHHNGKTNRNKVRYREYIDSNLSFLEVKRKNNKGKPSKKEFRFKNKRNSFGEHKAFVDEAIGEKLELFPRHWNRFQRVTFVHKRRKERLTIDVNFRFQDIKDTKIKLGDMVIAEVKQEKKKPFFRLCSYHQRRTNPPF